MNLRARESIATSSPVAGRGSRIETAQPHVDAGVEVVGHPLAEQVAGHIAVPLGVPAAGVVTEEDGVGHDEVHDDR